MSEPHAYSITIFRESFEKMLAFSRIIHRLTLNPAYVRAIESSLPSAARLDPGHASILMGFDFHLAPEGPKLIEINNNAGGLYCPEGHWLPQPEGVFDSALTERLRSMFPKAWRNIAIMDEGLQHQFMYPEMSAYAELLRDGGHRTWLKEPQEIRAGEDGLYADDARIDAIYNRHTDFYLESAPMRHIRQAYLHGQVALTPHPRSYALIGDKSRMALWSEKGFFDTLGLPGHEVGLIQNTLPITRSLDDFDADELWHQRKRWVFKPRASHASKGVVIGKSLRRKRFDEMQKAGAGFVVQEYVPPQKIDMHGEAYKYDLRLYMHGEHLIAVAARAYQGMVTNFASEHAGYLPVVIE